MNVTFLVPSTKRTIGGVISLYEFANGLSRRGHSVMLVHLPVVDGHIEHLDDVSWFTFEPAIEHDVVRSMDTLQLPEADYVETTALSFFEGPWSSDPERLLGPSAGLPFLFVQAYQFLPPEIERRAIATPGPKICIAKWMMDALLADGVPAEQLTYVPYGLDHRVYRLTRPIAERAAQVAMLYNAHPGQRRTVRARRARGGATPDPGHRGNGLREQGPSRPNPARRHLREVTTQAGAGGRDLQREQRVRVFELGGGLRPVRDRGHGRRMRARDHLQRRVRRLRDPRRERPRLRAPRRTGHGRPDRAPRARRATARTHRDTRQRVRRTLRLGRERGGARGGVGTTQPRRSSIRRDIDPPLAQAAQCGRIGQYGAGSQRLGAEVDVDSATRRREGHDRDHHSTRTGPPARLGASPPSTAFAPSRS